MISSSLCYFSENYNAKSCWCFLHCFEGIQWMYISCHCSSQKLFMSNRDEERQSLHYLAALWKESDKYSCNDQQIKQSRALALSFHGTRRIVVTEILNEIRHRVKIDRSIDKNNNWISIYSFPVISLLSRVYSIVEIWIIFWVKFNEIIFFCI